MAAQAFRREFEAASEVPGEWMAVDRERQCKCGRWPAAIGETEAEALRKLAELPDCDHGKGR